MSWLHEDGWRNTMRAVLAMLSGALGVLLYAWLTHAPVALPTQGDWTSLVGSVVVSTVFCGFWWWVIAGYEREVAETRNERVAIARAEAAEARASAAETRVKGLETAVAEYQAKSVEAGKALGAFRQVFGNDIVRFGEDEK